MLWLLRLVAKRKKLSMTQVNNECLFIHPEHRIEVRKENYLFLGIFIGTIIMGVFNLIWFMTQS